MQWIKQNLAGLLFLALAAALIAPGLAGCQFADLVKVRTTPRMQAELDVPAQVPLREAPRVVEKLNAHVAQYVDDWVLEAATFNDRTEAAAETYALIRTLLDSGISLGAEGLQSSGFPMAGALAGLLGTIGAFFLRPPGQYQDKMDSYNKGRADTIDALAKLDPALAARLTAAAT